MNIGKMPKTQTEMQEEMNIVLMRFEVRKKKIVLTWYTWYKIISDRGTRYSGICISYLCCCVNVHSIGTLLCPIHSVGSAPFRCLELNFLLFLFLLRIVLNIV